MIKKNQKIVEIIGVIIVLGVAVVYFSMLQTGQDASTDVSKVDIENIKAINNNLEQIKIAKNFEDNKHTYVGYITLPTPCYSISHEVIIAESYPEQVQIRLTLTEGSGVCAAVLTDTEFQVEFQASELANVQGYVNDISVEFVE